MCCRPSHRRVAFSRHDRARPRTRNGRPAREGRTTRIFAMAALLAIGACAAQQDRTTSASAPASAPSQAPAGSTTESRARMHAMSNGYSNVSTLIEADDGTWRGDGVKGGQTVNPRRGPASHPVAAGGHVRPAGAVGGQPASGPPPGCGPSRRDPRGARGPPSRTDPVCRSSARAGLGRGRTGTERINPDRAPLRPARARRAPGRGRRRRARSPLRFRSGGSRPRPFARSGAAGPPGPPRRRPGRPGSTCG